MTVLQDVAKEIGAHERTLRRGLSHGLLRGRRPSSRTVELAPGEVTYLRRHWALLAALREALRSEPNVRLAVLIGSGARGTLQERSDVDILVSLLDAGWRAQDRLRERLGRAAGRPVDLVTLEAARQDPLVLDSVLRDGRVLADREGRWPPLLAERSQTALAAARAAEELRGELHALVSELSGDA
ncbi:MAG: nucleotidyltransferase family protein [Solirubrobacteraceae bacterium]